MKFYRITDQITFRIINKELIMELNGVTYSNREKHVDDELVKDFGGFNYIVNKFVRKFSDSFTEDQTKKMLNRLNNLEIRIVDTKKKRFETQVSLGQYDNINNKITIPNYNDKRIPFDLEKTLMHELLHMASTRNLDNDEVITGLEIPGILGKNFNEAYTSYLTGKHFIGEETDINADMYTVIKGIEMLVGKEKLQECYFEANIGKLINEMMKYSTKVDVLKLFYLIDKMNEPFFSYKDYRVIRNEIIAMNIKKINTIELTSEEYDIELARIKEFRDFNIWSEDAEVIRDKDTFMFKEKDRTSEVFTFDRTNEDNIQFEKNY